MALLGAQFVNAVSPNPVGSLQAYAGASAPTGWLLCDGTSYSTSVYPELYSVLGYTYGGSGANFNVPDLRGRVPMGAGTGTGLNASGTGAPSGTAQTARTRGQWGGEETHALTGGETPAHTHAAGGLAAGVGAVNANQGWVGIASVGVPSGAPGSSSYTTAASSGIGSYGFSNYAGVYGNTGALTASANGTGHNTVPPFVVTNYIIKAVPDAPRSGLAYGSTPPIVTALPSNPQFGDVVTYIADATNGVAWNLQYDATGTYPWKFIGGAPWMEYAAGGNVAGATSSYTLLTGYTVALPGDYMVTVEVGFAISTTAAATYCEGGPVLNSEAFSYPNVASLYSSTANVGGPLVKTRRITAPSVGGVLRGVFQPNPAAGSFNRITETVTPVRVKAA